jgi:hypothetical protein
LPGSHCPCLVFGLIGIGCLGHRPCCFVVNIGSCGCCPLVRPNALPCLFFSDAGSMVEINVSVLIFWGPLMAILFDDLAIAWASGVFYC